MYVTVLGSFETGVSFSIFARLETLGLFLFSDIFEVVGAPAVFRQV